MYDGRRVGDVLSACTSLQRLHPTLTPSSYRLPVIVNLPSIPTGDLPMRLYRRATCLAVALSASFAATA